MHKLYLIFAILCWPIITLCMENGHDVQYRAVDSPASYFQSRLSQIRLQINTFEHIPSNLEAGWQRYIEGDPNEATVFHRWTTENIHTQMPIRWNEQILKYEFRRENLDNTSSAVVRFTWYYLKAYANLAPSLCRSHSPLARGAAALVAAEVVYRENMSCLPKELSEDATMVNVLLLYEPELLEACFQKSGRGYESIVRKAFAKMCTCSNREYYQEKSNKWALRPVHCDPSWFWRSPRELVGVDFDLPVSVQDFLPPHVAAVSRLLDMVRSERGVHNLTIKANIIAAACPELYGIPYFAQKRERVDVELLNKGNDWNTELESLLSECRKEMLIRKVEKVAPNYSQDRSNLAAGDPGILYPLMYIATNIAAKDIAAVKNQGGASLLKVLQTNEATKNVLDLAGNDPLVMISNEDKSDEVPRLCTLTWSSIVRAREGEKTRSERVFLELIDYSEVGAGKPITGISVTSLIRAQKDKKEIWIEAGKVSSGMKVMGYTQVGIPGSGVPVFLKGKVRVAWFDVVAVTHHKVPLALAIGIKTQDGDPSEIVLSYDHDVLISLPRVEDAASHADTENNQLQLIWRRAADVNIDNEIWVGGISGTVQYIKPLKAKIQELVEFGLTWKERGKANNLVAKTLGGTTVLVEAQPVNAGPIDPSEMILVDGDNYIQISSFVPYKSEIEREQRATQVAGYYVRPEDDPWRDNPLLSHHLTFGPKKSVMDVQVVYRLEFADSTEIKLGPNNWLLQHDGKKLTEIIVNDELPTGLDIVSGIDNQGNIQTKKLEAVTKITQPHKGFILLELNNLSWIKTPTIVVSVDYRPRDLYKEGIVRTTELALPLEQDNIMEPQISAPAQDESASSSVPIVRMAQETANIKDAISLRGRLLLAYDPGLEHFSSVSVGSLKVGNSTRILCVFAKLKDGRQQVMLECGPSQPLLCRPTSNSSRVIYRGARNLIPGDQIFVALPGQTQPHEWRVLRVTPSFYPSIPVVDLATPARQNWLQETIAETDVAFGNQIGFQMSVPRTDRIVPGRPDRPSQDGYGAASGLHEGGGCKGKHDLSKVLKPVIVDRSPEKLKDPIRIHSEAMSQLKQRQLDIQAYFDSERRSIKTAHVAKNFTQFWEELMGTISPEEIRNIVKNREDIPKYKRFELNEICNYLEDVPYAKPENIWPIAAKDVVGAMEDWMDNLLQVRWSFLQEKTNASWLSDLLTMELITSSWLESLGAERTAGILTSDMLELAIYAGCEIGCERKRLGDRGLNLEILLFAPDWIMGQQRQSLDTDMPIGFYAQEYVKNWMRSRGFEERVPDDQSNSIYLSILYAYWTMAGEHSDLDPLWRSGLTPLSQINDWQKPKSALDQLFYSVLRKNILRLQTRPCMVGESSKILLRAQERDTTVKQIDLNGQI